MFDHDNSNEKQSEHHERMRKFNTLMAVELIGQFLQNKVTSRILNLARQNIYMLISLSTCFSTIHLLILLSCVSESALEHHQLVLK